MPVSGRLDTSQLQRNLSRTLGNGFSVRVGFPGISKSGKRLVLLKDIAIWNFYGTRNIPARNPLEQVSLDGVQKVKGVGGLFDINSRGRAKALKALNAFMTQRVKKAFDGRFKPNAPSTIKQKGFNRPLYWTGKLRSRAQVQAVARK